MNKEEKNPMFSGSRRTTAQVQLFQKTERARNTKKKKTQQNEMRIAIER